MFEQNLEKIAAVVLAAGRGTRMKSQTPKVLQLLKGKPLIYYTLEKLQKIGIKNIFVVLNYQAQEVRSEIEKKFECNFVYQKELLGTANALKTALEQLDEKYEQVLLLNGDDSAFYKEETVKDFINSHMQTEADLTFMTLKITRGVALGRIIRDQTGKFKKVLEHKEFLDSGLFSDEINCGKYIFKRDWLEENISKVPLSQSGEYYVTELLGVAEEIGAKINVYQLKDEKEWFGINTQEELEEANNRMGQKGKRVHFMGIGGSGTSAVAALAQSLGFEVSGCDVNVDNEFTKDFNKSQLQKGHSGEHIKDIDILAVSPAVFSLDSENEELKEAQRNGVEVLTWQQFLGGYLLKDKFVISVCGTHGKSTTTAMIAKVFEDSNLDPTVVLGAIVPEWGKNFRLGKSKYFIVESDEFNDNFLHFEPNITILTNIDMDHPEYFKDFEHYKESFIKFLSQTKQSIIANISDPVVADVLKVVMKQSGVNVIDYSKNKVPLDLKVLGDFNKLNAEGVYQACLLLGIEPSQIRQSLNNYSGISRRMEFLGKVKEASVYSDFGHHPTEIKVTLEALRKKYPQKRIVLIFQPHMFSRTKALFDDFVNVFKNLDIDQIFILDIYPSREFDTGIVNSKELVEAISKRTVSYLGDLKEERDFLKLVFRKDDLVVFMGAGDIDQLARELVND